MVYNHCRSGQTWKMKTVADKHVLTKLGDKYSMVCQQKDVMCIAVKALAPDHLWSILDDMEVRSRVVVRRMLKNREENSSKYYKEVPCVVAKSLALKYQSNRKCKRVSRVVIPICGDKGRQVKLSDAIDAIRIPALFKKQWIPVCFSKPIVGNVRGVEFIRQHGKWFVVVQYDTPKRPVQGFSSVVGVDRNSRGNVAVACNLSTGKVRKLGPDAGKLKEGYRNRRSNLQSKGAFGLCAKISGQQERRTKDINHKVSKSVVDFAKSTSSAIVLEDLGTIRKGKARKYTEKSQWSYFQLDAMIRYKAALFGIPVFYVDPRNTSKCCSRCGTINSPNGKRFECSNCGHIDHRDVNAGFNIAKRFFERTSTQVQSACGILVDRELGSVSQEVTNCG